MPRANSVKNKSKGPHNQTSLDLQLDLAAQQSRLKVRIFEEKKMSILSIAG